MAEIATNVLHNIGNVLNSVNISATLVCGQDQESQDDRARQSGGAVAAARGQLGNVHLDR